MNDHSVLEYTKWTYGVSTGSDSDRVATDNKIEFARMLPGRYRSRY